jgi:hypothetical protein
MVRYIFVCMYVGVIYTCMVYEHVPMCMHMCMHVCMYVCIHVCIHMCVHVCIHMCACMCACMYGGQMLISGGWSSSFTVHLDLFWKYSLLLCPELTDWLVWLACDLLRSVSYHRLSYHYGYRHAPPTTQLYILKNYVYMGVGFGVSCVGSGPCPLGSRDVGSFDCAYPIGVRLWEATEHLSGDGGVQSEGPGDRWSWLRGPRAPREAGAIWFSGSSTEGERAGLGGVLTGSLGEKSPWLIGAGEWACVAWWSWLGVLRDLPQEIRRPVLSEKAFSIASQGGSQ